ncbi:MAG: PQQ-like beta-propeller repeat protein [Planctomycetota bacterium]|nr:PQQ-like beta-propeller repeat protein [Planctomycetota bacterium]MDA0920802.1 PQQ-like beta-propeller repeat protein [Planctomycetota bacterium]
MSEEFPDNEAVDQLFKSTTDVTSRPVTQPKEYRFRWGWGLGILLLGIAAELLVWNVIGQDRTHQVFYSLPVVTGTPFFLLIWWVVFSGIDWTTRFLGVGAVASVVLLFCSQYRFDGFEGDMIPRFEKRSTPTSEAQLAKFVKSQASQKSVATEWVIADEQPWPEYRGPVRDGVVREVPTDVDWSQAPKEVWRHPAGEGWSSFSVAEAVLPSLNPDEPPQSRTYLLTQEQRGEQECVVAYDAATGDQIWVHEDAIRFEEPLGGPGPRATPTVRGQLLYSLGATGQLNCLKVLTGEKVWTTNILEDAGAKNLNWAMSGSPLVVGEKVIVNPGGKNDRSTIAYHKETGDEIWAAGNYPASYTAPVLATLLGTQQVVIFGGNGPVGHDLESGKELWNFQWQNDPKVNAAIPTVVDDSSIMISCGYATGSALLRFSHEGDKWKVSAEWKSKRLKLKFNAPVRKGDYVYGLDEGILTCINLKTGNSEWKRGRFGYGQVLLCGDVLVVQAENSEVVFVAATPEKHSELGRFQAIEGKSWNHPVIWNGYLFVRNGEEAACFDLLAR